MPPARTLAEKLAAKQREISVAEFFERNRQILGFDNPLRALLTTVKESVDNSVLGDEPVLIRDHGEVRLVPIGDFADSHFDSEAGEASQSAPLADCEVMAFDDRTHIAGWQRASKVHRHRLRDRLFEIELQGGRKVTVTGSHSVFVLSNGRIRPAEVKDLHEGDHVVVPRNSFDTGRRLRELDLRPLLARLPESIRDRLMVRGVARKLPGIPRDWKRFDYVPYRYLEIRHLEVPKHARVSVRFGHSSLPVVLPLDRRFARLLGYYAAEGTCYPGLITLSFGSHEKRLLRDAEECVLSLGPDVRCSRIPAHPTATVVKIYSAVAALLFRDILRVGCKAGTKRVPDLVWNLERGLQEEFLRAYVAGDGYERNGKTVVATVSGELATGLQYLFGLHGRPYSVRELPARDQRFPGGHTSHCRTSFVIALYEGDRHHRAPLMRVPLEASGLGAILAERGRALPYTNSHRYSHVFHTSFEIPALRRTLGALSGLSLAAEEPFTERLERLGWLVDGDVGYLPVRRVRPVATDRPYVYDFTVPGFEKFLGGRGAIYLHNSLDATEEAQVLPDIGVEISRENGSPERLKVLVEDNGPGILRREVPNVFGRLLYGSRFHANRQSRGQQGIGISAAVLYAYLTTARPVRVMSKVEEEDVARVVDLYIDTQKNLPKVVREDVAVWDRPHGTRVELVLKAKYQRGRQSPYEYLKQTAIVNPHARIALVEPDGTRITYERASTEVPPIPKEVAPHPYGLELGELSYRLKISARPTLQEMLVKDLAGVTPRSAREVLDRAKVSGREKPDSIHGEPLERLLAALHAVPLLPPSTESLSPIGPMLIKRGLRNVLGEIRPDFYAPPVSRTPKVRGGFPFLVEVGLVFGGGLAADQPIQLLRFANRVPLLFQQGACAITNAVANLDWRRYGLDQKGGAGLPVGPCTILVHLASTKIPFTSEAKEAVAEDPEIDREVTLALQAAARHLKSHLSRRSRRDYASEKFAIISKILPKIADKTSRLLEKPVPDLTPVITRIMDVVHVDPQRQTESKTPAFRVDVTNYTPRARVLELFLEMPAALLGVATWDPEPDGTDAELGRAWWTLPKLQPSGRARLSLGFPAKTDVDEDDLDWYMAGVDEAHLLGAEPLPGDWDVRLPRAVIEAAEQGEELPGAAPEEGEEVDYDGAKASATADDED